jgi:hypothetical protein
MKLLFRREQATGKTGRALFSLQGKNRVGRTGESGSQEAHVERID